MIYHICTKDEYYKAVTDGEYKNDTLKKVDFIHCSLERQVEGVANSRFKGKKNLMLLVIDDMKLKSEIKYEGIDDNLFPHLYGPLNMDAVAKAVELKAGRNGLLSLENIII